MCPHIQTDEISNIQCCQWDPKPLESPSSLLITEDVTSHRFKGQSNNQWDVALYKDTEQWKDIPEQLRFVCLHNGWKRGFMRTGFSFVLYKCIFKSLSQRLYRTHFAFIFCESCFKMLFVQHWPQVFRFIPRRTNESFSTFKESFVCQTHFCRC